MLVRFLLQHCLSSIFGIDDAIIGGAAGLVGAGANIAAQSSANQTNIELQGKAQEFAHNEAVDAWARQQWMNASNQVFQREMSNSAYQRSTEDMRLAGINPMLAYMKGGASTPSGGSGSGTQASSVAPARVESLRFGDAVSKSVSTAMDMERFRREMAQRDVDIAKTELDAKAAQAAAFLNHERGMSVARENIYATPEKEREARLSELRLRKKTADFDSSLVGADGVLKRVNSVLGAATGAKSLIRRHAVSPGRTPPGTIPYNPHGLSGPGKYHVPR